MSRFLHQAGDDIMSKLVVLLLPGGAPEYVTVEDNQTTVTWFGTPEVAGGTGRTLPIETYFCEGEEFHFARLEKQPEEEVSSSIAYLTAQNPAPFTGLMTGLRQGLSFLAQCLNVHVPKKIRAK